MTMHMMESRTKKAKHTVIFWMLSNWIEQMTKTMMIKMVPPAIMIHSVMMKFYRRFEQSFGPMWIWKKSYRSQNSAEKKFQQMTTKMWSIKWMKKPWKLKCLALKHYLLRWWCSKKPHRTGPGTSGLHMLKNLHVNCLLLYIFL